MSLALDVLLALALVVLAILTVAGPGLFRAIVMFIVFGLMMALAWARLGAPDLALAEAAIGAGITGALLLGAFRALVRADPAKRRAAFRRPSRLALPVAVLATVLVAVLALALAELTPGPGTAGALARAALKDVELGNAVTGVLLLFRGYDTLLEIVVLLAAWLGAFALRGDEPPAPRTESAATVPLLDALLAAVVPLAVLVAVYLLRAGGHAAGGAFQAGAVLAAALVLLVLSGRLRPTPAPDLPQRVLLVLGVVVFGLLGLAMLIVAGQMLAMPGLWAVYLVEVAMMVSIATTLALLFAGAGGLRRAP
ncbi:MAG TPA: DUF4040 domain-containing protein [Xanthomonadaceae bacterium]|nr:DUF4040 domain-containing protein [Xanthomonadaceae bacterium]